MSIWMILFLITVLQSSAYAENDRKQTIGEQLDVIIKDVSGYLYWLFGYVDDTSIESQIEESELLKEEFVKDVNNMVELMHAEAEKHIKYAKDLKDKENKDERKNSEEKNYSDKKEIEIDSGSEEILKDDKEVIPLTK